MTDRLITTILDLLLTGEIEQSRCGELFENVIVSVSPHDFAGAARRGLTACLCRIICDVQSGKLRREAAILSLNEILVASASRDPRLRRLIAA